MSGSPTSPSVFFSPSATSTIPATIRKCGTSTSRGPSRSARAPAPSRPGVCVATIDDDVEVGPPLGRGEGDADDSGDDHAGVDAGLGPDADGDDRLAEGDDDDQPVPLGEVLGVQLPALGSEQVAARRRRARSPAPTAGLGPSRRRTRPTTSRPTPIEVPIRTLALARLARLRRRLCGGCAPRPHRHAARWRSLAWPGCAVTLRRRDRPRRRHGAAAVGGRRDGVLLVHDPAAPGRARLRLAAARHLPADGGRRVRSPAWRSASCRCARSPSLGVAVGVPASALVVSIARRRAGVAGQRAEHDRRTARVAAMTGIDRRRVRRPRAVRRRRSRVPAGARPRARRHRRRRARRRRRSTPAATPSCRPAAHARRRRVPRRRHRRHAARPLVPRAAGPAAAPAPRARRRARLGVADRGRSRCCCRPA